MTAYSLQYFCCVDGRAHALHCGSSGVKTPPLKIKSEVRLRGLWESKHQVSSSENHQGYLWEGHIFKNWIQHVPGLRRKAWPLTHMEQRTWHELTCGEKILVPNVIDIYYRWPAGHLSVRSITSVLAVPCWAGHSHCHHELKQKQMLVLALQWHGPFNSQARMGGSTLHCWTVYYW